MQQSEMTSQPLQRQEAGFGESAGMSYPAPAFQLKASQGPVQRNITPEQWRSREYTRENYRPASGSGLFDVHVNPLTGRLSINTRVSFNFISGSQAAFSGLQGQTFWWTQDEKDQYREEFMRLVEDSWSGHFHFVHPQLPGERVFTAVDLIESPDFHYRLHVTKIPQGDFRGSAVTHYNINGQAMRNRGTHYARLDSEDVNFTNKGVSDDQSGAVHEYGHMVGLGDEYPIGNGNIRHATLVQNMLGQNITQAKSNNVMSYGNTILPQHYVTFLDALRNATNMSAWTFAP